MSHPRDEEAWKCFDRVYSDLASEQRNVRLGLRTDSFSHFGMAYKLYSSWLVIVTPYNLSPWMCFEKEVMFLTAIILCPKNPKRKVDVYFNH